MKKIFIELYFKNIILRKIFNMHRTKKLLGLILIVFLSVGATKDQETDLEVKEDFLCKLVIQKNTCWNNYEVTTEIIDIHANADQQLLGKVTISKDKLYNSLFFKCLHGSLLSFSSSFSPPIFKEQKDKKFSTTKLWSVPYNIPKNADSWLISLCFPDDFHKVPMPLGAVRNCKCSHVEPLIIKSSENSTK